MLLLRLLLRLVRTPPGSLRLSLRLLRLHLRLLRTPPGSLRLLLRLLRTPPERALCIRERELGPDHLEVANTLHNLSGTERNLMDYERANELRECARCIRERQLRQTA